MTSPSTNRAQAPAEALGASGTTSDTPETAPNPFGAALDAFCICQGSKDTTAWQELKASLPRAAYHRKLADLCHRALRRPTMPDDLRERVAYAWGYFDGLLKAQIDADAPDEGTTER